MENTLPILKNLGLTIFEHDKNLTLLSITTNTTIGNLIKERGFDHFLENKKDQYLMELNDSFNIVIENSFGRVKIIGKKINDTYQGYLELIDENTCEKRFKILYQAAEEGIFIHDKGIFKDANEAFYRTTGYNKQELLKRNLLKENLFKLSQNIIFDMAKNLSQDKEAYYKNIEITIKDGSKKYASVKAKNLEGNNRAVIIQDVTEAFSLQKDLIKSKKHFKEITEHSTDVIITFSQGKMNYITPSINFLTNFNENEFKECAFVDHLHEDDREIFSLIIQEAKKSIKKTIPIVFSRIRRKGVLDEEKRWAFIESLVTFIDQETYVINLRDIGPRIEFNKERKRLEHELHHAKKMQTIGTLAGGIAHDFKNILMPIIGYANMITYDLDPIKFASIIDDLNKIIQAAERANELVNQILTFSHKKEIEKAPFQFNDLLNNTVSLLRASISSSVEFTIVNECKEALIKANYTQIQQVIMNVCTNASHSMNSQGPVRIFVRELKIRGTLIQRFGKLHSGDYVALSIEDKGHGISDDNIERIFDPFFTTKDVGKGTGLGLSVAQGIINNHNGLIHVTSRINKGTIFEIFLPIVNNDIPLQKENIYLKNNNRKGKGRILFIDDEEMTRDLVSRVLNRAGYEVKAMQDGQEALKELNKNVAYDLIITDQSMPKITGLEIARKAKIIIRDIPVILISGSAELLKIDTKKLGINEFSMKPVIPNDLLKMVQKYL